MLQSFILLPEQEATKQLKMSPSQFDALRAEALLNVIGKFLFRNSRS
jgi:hypothetical protein